MKVKYYYSACIGIKTPDVSILCDPWFTDGIYDGAWYQFPRFESPLERIEKYDLIYISHIHPDHYDPVFIKEYLKKYPDTKIIAGEKYLINALKREGLPLYREEPFTKDHAFHQIKDTLIQIFINDTESISDIDTALVVKCHGQSVVNMNDNIPNAGQLGSVKNFLNNERPTVALLGYAGAGPYPQTYYTDHQKLMELAEKKKQDCFDRYKELDNALNAKINIPFAGQYVLGGSLVDLNKYRGVPDAVEVYEFDDKAIVLNECAEFNLDDLDDAKEVSEIDIRIRPYEGMEEYIETLRLKPLDYENLNIPLDKIPFERLLRKAYERALKANEYKGEDYFIIIKLLKGYFVCNINKEKAYITEDITDLMAKERCSFLQVNLHLLFGLLTGIYHWNNAEVGSHFRTTRSPDVFNRDVQRFLNFFYV